MNLQTHVRLELWLAISNTYQAKNYSHAILDAMHYLSTVLREKTGIDGDGVSLVGQALGGNSPRLRVNKLQTETERDIQKGLENVLRGLYLAIRNPRSHEQVEDTEDTADSVIYFINYVVDLIDKAEEPFTLAKFLDRVFDQDFYASERYAELLAEEVPANKQVDTLIEIYRKRTQGKGNNNAYIIMAIIKRIPEEQLDRFLSVVSEDLEAVKDDRAIRYTLQILPPHLWPRLTEVARLRIENKLIGLIQGGKEYTDPRIRSPGALGTWARDFLDYFTLKLQVGCVLIAKLKDEDEDVRRYVARYFMVKLPTVITLPWQIDNCVAAISKAIRNGDESVREELLKHVGSFPDIWQRNIVDSMKDLTDPDSPAIYLPDGIPFLKTDEEPPTAGEELPF